MWKSLCLVLISVYFIPSSDADCDYDALLAFCQNSQEAKNICASFSSSVIPLNPLTLTALHIETIAAAGIYLATYTKPDGTKCMVLYIDFKIVATVAALEQPLASIQGTLLLCVRLCVNKEGALVLASVQLYSNGHFDLSIIDGVNLSLAGKCTLLTDIQTCLRGVLSGKCENFLNQFNAFRTAGCPPANP